MKTFRQLFSVVVLTCVLSGYAMAGDAHTGFTQSQLPPASDASTAQESKASGFSLVGEVILNIFQSGLILF